MTKVKAKKEAIKVTSYILEVANELTNTGILATWHPEYGRLYLAETVTNAFNIMGVRYNSVVRNQVGSEQRPALSLIQLERLKLQVKLSENGQSRSRLVLTSLGFVNFLETSNKDSVKALRAYVTANTNWDDFKLSILQYGFSKVESVIRERLYLEHELLTKIGTTLSPNLTHLTLPASI